MRKNVASQVVAFQMINSSDGSAVTTGTPTVYYTIDGGTQATGGGTATHEGQGQWSYVPLQAETNGNHVAFTMVLANAINQTVNVWPVSFDPTDAADLGITALTGHTPQTGDTYALANGATGFAAINTDVELILADTNELQTNQGNWLTATGFATSSALATAQTDLDTITGADGATLASTQGAITWGAVTVSVADGLDNITLAGSGTGDGLAFTRSGSGGLFETAWAAAVESEVNDALVAFGPATPAEVNAQVVDVIRTDTVAELSSVPAATSTLADKINFLFMLARNKGTQTSTTKTLRNDADTADVATSTVSDDGATFTKGEFT